MNGVRLVLCGGARPSVQSQRGEVDSRPLRLDLHASKPNVFLKIANISEAMLQNVPAVLLDLLEIAVYVLAADQATSRGGTTDAGERWRRRFEFHIPVRNPDHWSSAPVKEALSESLSFLTDDDYAFVFSQLGRVSIGQLYLEGLTKYVEGDEVLLFSGGLDSLAGAIQETLDERKSVLLISHDSATKRKPRVESLAKEISQLGKAHHVAVRATKSDRMGHEFTQRSRSFLYASLAAAVAGMLGRDRIRFYENGVTSINLPIAPQVLGGRASRTTHPQALRSFGRLLSAVLERPFAVENPFLWKTKGDVVRLIKEHGLASLVARSVSCSRTIEATKLHTHCGRCSQCIDRRFATLAANLSDDEDPPEMYKVDLMTGERPFGETRAMAESFLQRATRIRSIDELDFLAEYPEVTRVVRHVGLPAEHAGRNIIDLHRRHADEVFTALAEGHKRHALDFQQGKLPDSCLLVLAVPGRYRRAEERGHELETQPTFRLEGEFWRIFFDNERVSLKDNVGLRHLARLLASPGQDRHASELMALEAGVDRMRAASPGQVSDRTSLNAYRQRLAELEEEIQTADGDPAKTVEVREEHDRLSRHLASITDHHGKLRSVAGDDERARQAVSVAIRRALRTLSKKHTPLSRHLYAHLKLGVVCTYKPERVVNWVTN